MTETDAGDRRKPALPANARDAIGRKLRENLDRIVAEPVPDRFLKLLDDLEAGSAAPARSGERATDAEGADA